MSLDPDQATIQQTANLKLSALLDPVGHQTVSVHQVDLIAANAAVNYVKYRGPDAWLVSVDSVLTIAALATGDATLDVKVNGVSAGVLTITQVGSATGDEDQLVLTGAKLVTGDLVSLEVAGANTASARADVSLALASALAID